MKLSEVFEKAGVETDEKARRIRNTSEAVATITASEIEDGVTLERLEQIGVPVYRYTTQITIHGVLPGFSEDARPAGFKSVFRNGNGTLGVKYVAIDAEKKLTMRSACRFGPKGWATHLNSEGLTVARWFEEKTACIDAYKSFPKDLICGSVTAGAGVYGGFWVIAYIGAVPETNLWPLISQLWGIASADQLAALEAARDAENARDQAEREAAAKARKEAVAIKKAELAASLTLDRITQLPKGECRFLRIVDSFSLGVVIRLYTFKKRGPTLCFGSQDYPAVGEPTKFAKLEPHRRASFDADAKAGFVFKVPNA